MEEEIKEEVKSDPRTTIRARELVLALEEHVIEGKKMSASQVSAAIALLKKVLPDLPGSAGEGMEEKIKTHEEALKELV